MNTLTVPQARFYADGEGVIAVWRAGEEWLRTIFQLVEEDGTDYAVLVDYSALLDGGATPVGEAGVEDVPYGVRWVIIEKFGVQVVDGEDREDGQREGLPRGGFE
jgi:hypothetical protein